MRVYGTGIAMEIPEGHVGLLFPRSSISKTNLSLRNSVGVIDSNYRGEIMLKFLDLEEMDDLLWYLPGNKIGQIMIIERPQIELEEVEELSETDRGGGGFGSTGS
jgi:dUTP pyrophosphatase